jgi:hypothetical protein
MTLTIAGLMVLASIMRWANQNGTVTMRNNEYFTSAYAAEAANEKIISYMVQDYLNYGPQLVAQNLSTYNKQIPTSTDNPNFSQFRFTDGTTANQILVTRTSTGSSVVLGPPYQGLTMTADIYELIANAVNTTTEFHIQSTVGEQISMGTIPLFQFAIFYQNDMEIAPGAAMTINGPVHGNANIYLQPQDGLTFNATVSAVNQIVLGESPQDPTDRTPSAVTFSTNNGHLSDVNPLVLPVGTNNSGSVSNVSQNVNGILQPPQSGQTPTSTIGTNLLYNQADMIIMVSNNSITVTSGAGINNQATVIPSNQWQLFINTNGSFYDQRDSLTVNPVTLNVSNLVNWSATNNTLGPALAAARGSQAANVQSIYIDDQRSTSNQVITTITNTSTNYSTNLTTTSSYPSPGKYVPPVTTNGSGGGKTYTYKAITSSPYTTYTYLTNFPVVSQPGIVLSNGATLTPQGLSIATPDPAYIIGNWNVQTNKSNSDAGQSSTAYTYPSAIFADAITVLSSAWNPANSTLSINSRNATTDTVNAAFLTGNVPSNEAYYSGGVENFPRFLENWSGQTFYYNGSMVGMFSSLIANAPWPGTGVVYNPPNRVWAFDNNFTNPSKQPPMTPSVRYVHRAQWTLLGPNTTSF